MPRRFRYAINVELRTVYDNNVTLANADKKDDVYALIAPEIVLGLGDVEGEEEDYLSLEYTPSAYIFAEHSEFTTVEHLLRFAARWHLGRMALILRQDIQSVQSANLDVPTGTGGLANQINLDVGGRRRLNTYSSEAEAEYILSGKTTLSGGLEFTLADYEELIGSTTLSAHAGVTYTYSQKMSFGLSLRGGKIFVDEPSNDRVFEQINFRAAYGLTGKLRAQGAVGVDFRQTVGGTEEGGQTAPIFRLGLAYTPFDGTEITLDATRRVLSSASIESRDFTSTQIVLNTRQRLFQRVYVSLGGGYQNQSYFSTVNGLSADREDNYLFVVPSIDVSLTKFWSAGIFFLYRQNDSSLDRFGFEVTQFGLRTTLKF